MRHLRHIIWLGILVGLASSAQAAEWGMKLGNPELKSAGPLAFGNNGVLFVGDTKAAAVVALATGDKSGDPNEVDLHAHAIDKSIAQALGSDSVTINDLAVNPASGVGYVSVSHGAKKTAAIVKILPNGDVEVVDTQNIEFSKVSLPNAPADKVVKRGRREVNYRDQSITDVVFSEGKVLVSGVGGNKGEANVRELIFPFSKADKGVNIEIFHGAHGKYEGTASVKTFVPFKIDGEPHLLAGFQCTPLVKFPVKSFRNGAEKVRGTTLAELGNRNQPLDMIVYRQDGKDYLLITNTERGVMKVSTDDVERPDGITERIQGTAGQKYETIEDLENIEQLDRLNDAHAVVIAKNDDGTLDLHTIDLP